jgi:predicted nucleic acid-binding protein
MKLFLDTNIFPEFINRRAQYSSVCRLIDAVVDGRFIACISSGCIYTLSFLFERSLKIQGIHKPEQTERLRHYLSEVLQVAELIDMSHVSAEQAIKDKNFTDIEDSFQYRCAIENHCDVLITINIDDFKNADQSQIEIMTPVAFVEKYNV